MEPSPCAPTRSLRPSKLLQRQTCLLPEEERIVAAGGSEGVSDRELARRARIRDVVRPSMPTAWSREPRAWLSNYDIDAVMHQYCRQISWFRYIGTLPTDFAERRVNGTCVRICSASKLTNIYRRRMLAAAVVNMDVHTGRGTHWVALALDCRSRRPQIVYYDPLGRAPPRRWVKGTWSILAAAVPESCRYQMLASARYNTRVHQRGGSECGVFSMMAIDAMISGKSFEEICSSRLTDDDAFMQRRWFFDPSGSSGSPWSWGDLVAWARGGAASVRAERARRRRALALRLRYERRR